LVPSSPSQIYKSLPVEIVSNNTIRVGDSRTMDLYFLSTLQLQAVYVIYNINVEFAANKGSV